MTKAVFLPIGFLLLAMSVPRLPAQTNSAAEVAVAEAVKRQADTITLQNKLVDARNTLSRGDLVAASTLYQEACTLAQEIGPGIPAESREAIAGLDYTCMTLAREAQRVGNLREANIEVNRVLSVDPKNPEAFAFKQHNDQLLAAMKGRMPDEATVNQVPYIAKDITDAGTLVRDGKLLYEMGKLNDAEVKLTAALKLDPDNIAASYYLNLIQQARYRRESADHTVDTQKRMAQVERQWVPPPNVVLEAGNPYAQTNLIHTGPGREIIVNKLNRERFDNVNFDGLPLSEVLRQLNEKARLADPDKKGINFLINPNLDNTEAAEAAAGNAAGAGGFGGGGGGFGAPAPAISPVTGLPEAGAAAQAPEVPVDQVIIKLNLSDVRLADVLDAIVTVADHPIKYSIVDYGIVFSAKGANVPQLYMRTFKVDPNTFYSGLESVSSASFGSVYQSGGGAGGAGASSSGQGQNNGAVVGVVNAFAGAGGFRNTGQGGGGGGGGGQQGQVNPLGNQQGANGTTTGGGGGGNMNQGGLRYVTQVNLAQDVSLAARNFFTTLGVNMNVPPGKSVFFNDRLGLLFVRATDQDLDTIERAIQALNQVAPEVHIKARFIEVQQNDQNQLGFDWFLGQVNLGNGVVGNGGSAPSLNVPVSAANPLGTFPGNTTASQIGGAATDQQLFSSGLSGNSSVATITGILTDPNFRVVLHALEQRSGVENLAEPEVVTTSGRQTQMRATTIQFIITGFSFQAAPAATSTTGAGGVP